MSEDNGDAEPRDELNNEVLELRAENVRLEAALARALAINRRGEIDSGAALRRVKVLLPIGAAGAWMKKHPAAAIVFAAAAGTIYALPSIEPPVRDGSPPIAAPSPDAILTLPDSRRIPAPEPTETPADSGGQPGPDDPDIETSPDPAPGDIEPDTSPELEPDPDTPSPASEPDPSEDTGRDATPDPSADGDDPGGESDNRRPPKRGDDEPPDRDEDEQEDDDRGEREDRDCKTVTTPVLDLELCLDTGHLDR